MLNNRAKENEHRSIFTQDGDDLSGRLDGCVRLPRTNECSLCVGARSQPVILGRRFQWRKTVMLKRENEPIICKLTASGKYHTWQLASLLLLLAIVLPKIRWQDWSCEMECLVCVGKCHAHISHACCAAGCHVSMSSHFQRRCNGSTVSSRDTRGCVPGLELFFALNVSSVKVWRNYSLRFRSSSLFTIHLHLRTTLD